MRRVNGHSAHTQFLYLHVASARLQRSSVSVLRKIFELVYIEKHRDPKYFMDNNSYLEIFNKYYNKHSLDNKWLGQTRRFFRHYNIVFTCSLVVEKHKIEKALVNDHLSKSQQY